MDKSEFYANARTDVAGPLEGLRVVESTTTWAGPMCGCILADMGAEVIKVEHPAGEVSRRVPPLLPGTKRPLSFMHATVNRNKRSVTLDLHDARGKELFLALANTADVVVENFRPGTMARWGVGYPQVAEDNPGVVYVAISGYGQFGPEHDRAGYDPVAQASSGWLSLNGEPDGVPVKAPTFIGDDLGGLHGALAALGALRHRDRTGEGQYIDVALQDCLLFQSNGYPALAAMGVPLPRMGSQFVVAAPAGVYKCRDGYVMAGVLLDAHWQRMAGILGRPELADHPDWATGMARIAKRDEANAMLDAFFADLDADEITRRFLAEGLPVSPVRSYADAATDPHVLERDALPLVELEDGTKAPTVGPAAKFSRTPTRVRSGAPALGRDTDAVLAELGISDAELGSLREKGVV